MSSCTFCIDACPAGAITCGDAGLEIGPSCLNCGVCHAACPTGAFDLSQHDDASIFEDPALPEGREKFVISCLRGEEDADLQVSCLGRLTELLLLQPLHLNRSVQLEIIQPACDECPMKRAMARFADLLVRVGHLLTLAGAEQSTISVRRIPLQPPIRKFAARENGSRREFLHAIGKKTTDVMAATLPQTEQKATPPVPANRQEKSTSHKHTKLMALLRTLTENSLNQPLFIPADEALFAEISINSSCTACGVCAAICPTGALKMSKNNESICISFHAGTCVGCGICAAVCRPSAIERSETVLLERMLAESEVKVFTATRRECRICRLDFTGQGVDGICPLCVHLAQRRQAALQNLFQTREL
jgi:ferredoxin